MSNVRIDDRWRTRHADKLGSAAEAVGVVANGDQVWMGGWTSVPMTLSRALAERRRELRRVRVYTYLTPFNWDDPALLESFEIVSFYAGPFERPAVVAGRFEYAPVAQWRAGRLPPGFAETFDVAMIPISPPDEAGYCSFGSGVWFSPTVADHSKILIGEVHPEFIRTGGQNRIHVSRFDRLAEIDAKPSPPPIPARSEETEIAAQVICTLVAAEIVRDRATLQVGVGDVSAAMFAFLEDKHDLGVHTELCPAGIADLVQQGIVTGKYKSLHPGKVVASAFAQLPKEELDFIDQNPVFELYDFSYTDDLRNLLRLENFIAINNALAVDLTGNVCSETRGAQVFSGPGGQPAFAVGASTSSGGSVIVLPSSQLLPAGRCPRIVAQLDEGSTVTVHRGFVDYVVTEQGVARLRGKTLRQRIGEMISVAHPDFRGELEREAKRLHGISV
ncbi:MAG: acetyl-CoA hydrolase/transferase family protein [Candidatus Binatia bacterium]